MTAAWHPDPTGRYEQRWWDGAQWTEHVAIAGVQQVDPMGAAMGPPGTGPGPQFASPVPQQGYAPYPYATRSTNGLAVASLVLGILWIWWVGSILAIVFGFVAKSQIRQANGAQGGDGMATAGIVLGFVGFAVLALVIIVAIAASNDTSSTTDFGLAMLAG